MAIERLWLHNFRNVVEAEISFAPGTTVVSGANGQGKTNLVEAIALLARLRSFRGAPTDALVRTVASAAVVRGEIDAGGREVLIEIELSAAGRVRTQINRQRLTRARDIRDAFLVTVFGPDDLEIVKGGPHLRRRFLDDILVNLHRENDEVRSGFDRVLKQRNALLRQAHGSLDAEAEATLAVWDEKLVEFGERLASERVALIETLAPLVATRYEDLAEDEATVSLCYSASWRDEGLAHALEQHRRDELRRGVSLVGPHRDDLRCNINGLPSRTHASQGEQRSLALALRLGEHDIVNGAAANSPVVLLDDVFSELDEHRAAALVGLLPATQTIVTTATGTVPLAAGDTARLVVEGGVIR